MSSDFKQASPEGLQHFIYVSYLPWIKGDNVHVPAAKDYVREADREVNTLQQNCHEQKGSAVNVLA